MRFLIDQNLPVRLVDVLAEFGHDATHIKIMDLAQADDAEIWRLAVSRNTVVVSKDKISSRWPVGTPRGQAWFISILETVQMPSSMKPSVETGRPSSCAWSMVRGSWSFDRDQSAPHPAFEGTALWDGSRGISKPVKRM